MYKYAPRVSNLSLRPRFISRTARRIRPEQRCRPPDFRRFVPSSIWKASWMAGGNERTNARSMDTGWQWPRSRSGQPVRYPCRRAKFPWHGTPRPRERADIDGCRRCWTLPDHNDLNENRVVRNSSETNADVWSQTNRNGTKIVNLWNAEENMWPYFRYRKRRMNSKI